MHATNDIQTFASLKHTYICEASQTRIDQIPKETTKILPKKFGPNDKKTNVNKSTSKKMNKHKSESLHLVQHLSHDSH